MASTALAGAALGAEAEDEDGFSGDLDMPDMMAASLAPPLIAEGVAQRRARRRRNAQQLPVPQLGPTVLGPGAPLAAPWIGMSQLPAVNLPAEVAENFYMPPGYTAPPGVFGGEPARQLLPVMLAGGQPPSAMLAGGHGIPVHIDPVAATAGGGGQGPGVWQDPSIQLQLEMARQLLLLRRKRSGTSDSGTRSSEEGSDGSLKGGSKLRAILRLRQRVKKHPLKIIMKYRARCLRRLGIYALPNGMLSSAYTHPATSLHLRSTFGRMTGLWRCHFAASHILELIEHRKMEEAGATAVQVLKAIHQTALDGGSWNSAVLLLPWDDPLQKDLFGGDEQEMMAAASWNRGIKDLQLQMASLAHGGGGDGEDAQGPSNSYSEGRAARRAAAKAKSAAPSPKAAALPGR